SHPRHLQPAPHPRVRRGGTRAFGAASHPTQIEPPALPRGRRVGRSRAAASPTGAISNLRRIRECDAGGLAPLALRLTLRSPRSRLRRDNVGWAAAAQRRVPRAISNLRRIRECVVVGLAPLALRPTLRKPSSRLCRDNVGWAAAAQRRVPP